MKSVFKFCVIWGLFLTWFADALLFDMIIKTGFEEPVQSIGDLIERDMTLGNEWVHLNCLNKIPNTVFQILTIDRNGTANLFVTTFDSKY